MRTAPQMHVEWVDDEAVVLDEQTGRVHHLNPPAALVYALVLEHGYEAAIAKLRGSTIGTDVPESDVDELIRQMVEKGLLIDDG